MTTSRAVVLAWAAGNALALHIAARISTRRDRIRGRRPGPTQWRLGPITEGDGHVRVVPAPPVHRGESFPRLAAVPSPTPATRRRPA